MTVEPSYCHSLVAKVETYHSKSKINKIIDENSIVICYNTHRVVLSIFVADISVV